MIHKRNETRSAEARGRHVDFEPQGKIVLDPSESAAPHMQLGAAAYEKKDLATARDAFTTALSLQPGLTPAKFNLAVISRELEENDHAEVL